MAEAPAIEQGDTALWRAKFKRWTMLIATSAVLAACQVIPKGPPKTVEAPPPIEAPPTTTPLPTDVARHRIALLVPTTGSNAAVGESIANAANLAVLDTGGKSIRHRNLSIAAFSLCLT